jgi:rare lipoprotein A (peptidoglycan hydrolase)
MPFNPQGMEAAIPLSLIEKHRLKFGQLVRVNYYNAEHKDNENTLTESITVRIVDIGPSEKLCAEGRIIDLTEFAFSQLEDPSKGIIDVEMELL